MTKTATIETKTNSLVATKLPSGDALSVMAEYAYFFGGAGDDVFGVGDNTYDASAYGGATAVWVSGGDGDDAIYLMTDGDNVAFGGAGDDFLNGGSHDDRLDGGKGDDGAFGGAGDDEIFGGAGEDHLRGGWGRDTIDGGADNDLLEGGDGSDTLFGGAGDDVIHTFEKDAPGVASPINADGGTRNAADGGDGDDVIHGAFGKDTLNGGAGDDVIMAGGGDDRISGDDGADTLHGGVGDDVIFGGAGDDDLTDGMGDDIVHGGTGDDRIALIGGDDIASGGAGADVFAFDGLTGGAASTAFILDFDVAEDRLDLSNYAEDVRTIEFNFLRGFAEEIVDDALIRNAESDAMGNAVLNLTADNGDALAITLMGVGTEDLTVAMFL